MPALLSNAEFLTKIQAISVTGVTRHYDEPPASIDIATGPAAFPTMPDASRGDMITSCVDMSKNRNIGFVIIVEATGQGTQAQNYGKLAALMDALETALDALTPSVFNFVEYTIGTNGNYLLGDSAYWAIVADITVRAA
jgi:hypothetical protein